MFHLKSRGFRLSCLTFSGFARNLYQNQARALRFSTSSDALNNQKEVKPLPSTVKGFLSRPGHEVKELLSALTPEELETKVGPESNDDVLIYHRLISNTDIENITLKLIRQFENKMLGINKHQLENRIILNSCFEAFLSRRQYVKYFLLLRRIELFKNKIVPLNMILQHYITDLKDLDGARRIYLKFTKLGQLPNDATMTILFKAYNIQFSNKSKFAVSLDSRNETFYKNLIMKLVFEKNSFCREISSYETVLKNAFRFSCYRLPLQFSLQLLDKVKRNEDADSRNENMMYLDSVNMFWRGMGIKSMYFNRFDEETKKDLYLQANKIDSKAHLSHSDETLSDSVDASFNSDIDEKTGSFVVSRPQNTAIEKPVKIHPDYTLLLNFTKFKDFLDLFVEKQKKVSEMGLHEIITMLNSRANVVTNSAEERHHFQNLIFNLLNKHFKPLTSKLENSILARIDNSIDFKWNFETLRKADDPRYLMNSHTFEQLVKISSDIKNKPMFLELFNVLRSSETQFKKLQTDYNYAKWLLSLNKFYSKNMLNEKRREALEEVLPLVVGGNCEDSLMKFYKMTIPKWFNDQCLANQLNKEDLSKEMQRITAIVIKFIEKENIRLSKEEVILMFKKTFKDYVKRYQML